MDDSLEGAQQDENLNPSVLQHREFSVDPVLDHRPEVEPQPHMVEVSKTVNEGDKLDSPVLKHKFIINNSNLDHKSPVYPRTPMVKTSETVHQCDTEIKQCCHPSIFGVISLITAKDLNFLIT